MGFDNFEHYRQRTEAINGRLETLRGIAMGFDNFEHYRQRSLIHSGRIKDILTH